MTNVVLDELVRSISESVARSLLKEYGNSLTESDVAIKAAGTIEALYDLDAGEIIDLVVAYVKHGSVHVEIPTWRVKQDGTLRTDEEMDKVIW